MNTDVAALVVAAGQGTRLGEPVPKVFVELNGQPLLALAVESLLASGAVQQIIVVVPAGLVTVAAARLPAQVRVVAGGAERSDSVRSGLSAISAERVLVHDAARALAPPALIAAVAAALRDGCCAVVPALAVTDTIKTVDDAVVTGTPVRSSLRAIQTPQGFTTALLRRAHTEAAGPVTDDATMVERLGVLVHTVPGDPLAFKITTQLDLTLARALLAAGNPDGRGMVNSAGGK